MAQHCRYAARRIEDSRSPSLEIYATLDWRHARIRASSTAASSLSPNPTKGEDGLRSGDAKVYMASRGLDALDCSLVPADDPNRLSHPSCRFVWHEAVAASWSVTSLLPQVSESTDWGRLAKLRRTTS